MSRKPIVTKVSMGKAENAPPKGKESVRIVLSRVATTLRTALQNLDDAIDHLSESNLDGARHAVLRVIDMFASEEAITQLQESAEEINNKIDAIEELRSELL